MCQGLRKRRSISCGWGWKVWYEEKEQRGMSTPLSNYETIRLASSPRPCGGMEWRTSSECQTAWPAWGILVCSDISLLIVQRSWTDRP